MGRKVKITPEQEQIMFSKIACITLNLTNLVNGTEPREQTINTQTINRKMSKFQSQRKTQS